MEDHSGGPQPRRRLTQAESREQTRHRLLGAAAKVFAEKGYAGASLEEISELAGYTTGALYYHFSNKQQLFLELLRAGWSRQNSNWAGTVTTVFEDARSDPFDALDRFVATLAEWEDALEPLQGEFWLYALRNPDGMALIADELREQVELLQPVIATAMKEAGTPTGIDPAEMTTLALATFQGLARRRRIDPTAVADDLFARALRRLFAPGAGARYETGVPDSSGQGPERPSSGDSPR